MPLYDYHCRDCESQSELLVRNNEEQPCCPACGSSQMMRLLSVPAAHRGSGSPEPGQGSGGPPGPCGSGCGCFPGQ